ncbi:DUF2062 domain-containing protein [Pseudomarimonas arenosa]|uniref:DUF2062 domain-containing protein n=1 Tax=Pseudomarimonas arenosa TaxID=2774145 RepID=A0AAW3ZPY2_9GAMM|nr:DUF2062 domain-containing protein [Pseudomarimonas arenosa]MBD8526376.1 DUF2062 domain-containing protein [Pseudomarimonas arenosa]
MSEEYERHFRELLARRRRLRKLLRPLPRRANVRRYPVVKWFAEAARKRPFLWSLKRENVLPALYLGSIVSLWPLYGFQLVVAVFVALYARANLTITVALQFITNPLTLIPIYGFTYWVGRKVMGWMGVDTEFPSKLSFENMAEAGWDVLAALFLGGLVVGLGVALICDVSWRLLSWEARVFRNRLAAHRIRKELMEAAAKDRSGGDPAQ